MLQVIGAGFGRTGTHSLALALDRLGFGLCYTLLDVEKNIGHTELWLDALEGRSVNWTALFQNYRSTVEWPSVSFLPSLIHQFPQAKIILTIRDPDSWFESAAATIFPGLEATAKHPDLAIRKRSSFKRRLILEQQFSGRYWERSFAIRVFKNHIQTVEDLVPDDRLLRFNVQDGWLPLCRFLDVAEPGDLFPKRNERAAFLASAPNWAIKVMEENKNERDNQRLIGEKNKSDGN